MPDPNQNNDNQNPVSPTVMDISSVDQPVITPSSDSTAPSVIPPPVTPPADPIVAPVNVPPDSTNQVSEIPSFLHSTDLPPLAPDFQNVSGGADTVNKTEDKNVPDANSGTNAPFPDLPITTGSPKKKFGGGKIIATILGLFLLIGGIGAGVYLVQQDQNPNKRASSGNSCFDSCREDSGRAKCNEVCDTNYNWQVNLPNYDGGEVVTDGPNAGCKSNEISCNSVDSTGKAYDFCISSSSSGGCNAAAVERGYTIQYANSGNVSGQSTTYFCPKGTLGTGTPSCDLSRGGTVRNDLNKNSCFCGIIQIDSGSGFVSYESSCGCGGNDEEPATITPTTPPTTPPTISAQCQNIKAYSPTWALLTTTQLSALTVGSQVNFCVTGSATSESFDRAKFTINTVTQTETTTKRPTTNDFCQSYAIPAGVTSFNITAQIHHATLGWK